MMIANWRQSWRLWSVRVSALGAVLATTAAAAPDALISAWQSLPEEIRYVVPEHVGRWITPVLFAASLAARILKQRERTDGSR